MMIEHFRRAQALLETGRFEDAERELRAHLMHYPDDPLAHTWIAQAILMQEKPPADAVREAMIAVSLAPFMGFPHAILSHAFEKQGKLKDAERAALEAIRLEPDNASYHARLSAIYVRSSRWAEAAAAAQRGLDVDPDNVPCVNLRAITLRQMGKRDDASAAIETALALDPANSATHANQGWLLLDRGEPDAAISHFRESLRLDPESKWARDGILEALRARNPLYRLMLRYFLWMGKMPSHIRWAIVIGGYFASQFLARLADSYPVVAPLALTLLGLYLAFAYLTWTAKPLSSLLLRFDPVGRIALTPTQLKATNAVAVCLIVAVLLLAAGISLRSLGLIVGAVGASLLLVPLSGLYAARTAWGRWVISIYTGVMAAVGVATTIAGVLNLVGPFSIAIYAFLWMLVIYFWGGNLLLSRA